MSNLAFDYYKNNSSNAIIYDFVTHQKISTATDNNNTYDGNRAGMSCEVDAFRTDEEIKVMIDVYDKHINEASNNEKKKLACRNKMLFIIGINIGLRASDLRTLTWDFFFEDMGNGELKFRDGYNLRPKKTRKAGKYVKLYFNDSVKKIINWYISMYPINNLGDFIFKSRVGDDAITVNAMWRVIKDAAKEAGIKRNIGTHSLRRTFCRRAYDNAVDKSKALLIIQKILNHSSQAVTMQYLGLLNEEIEDVFDSMNIGFDMI